jgi:hypothetical protein
MTLERQRFDSHSGWKKFEKRFLNLPCPLAFHMRCVLLTCSGRGIYEGFGRQRNVPSKWGDDGTGVSSRRILAENTGHDFKHSYEIVCCLHA